MKGDGIAADALEPVLGWFFLSMARLTTERRERVVATLMQDGFDPQEARKVCLRLKVIEKVMMA